MTIESKLQTKEESRAIRLGNMREYMLKSPEKFFAKMCLVPGYAARFALNIPKDKKDSKKLVTSAMALEVIRDAGYVSLIYKTIEYLIK